MKSRSGIKSGVEVHSQNVNFLGIFGKQGSGGRLTAPYYTDGLWALWCGFGSPARVHQGDLGTSEGIQEHSEHFKKPRGG